MNKKLFVIAALIIIAVGGGFTYLLFKDKNTGTSTIAPKQDNTSQTPQAVSSDAVQSTEGAGMYKEYSEHALGSTAGTKILFFHASWCPQCRQLESSIKEGMIPEGVTIFKVDYDSSQKLRQKYGVTLQTTLVRVNDDGDEVKKFIAYDEPSLEALVRNLL